MLAQDSELELCRGGKHTGMSYAVTIRCKVFAICDPMTGTTANPPEIRRPRIRRSSIEML